MPIEPATPPVFNISKVRVYFRAYDSLDSEYKFDKYITPSEFSFGDSTSLFALKIKNLSTNNIIEDVFYNDSYSNSIKNTYYYDLGNLTAKNSSLQLKDTKSVGYINISTYSTNGTTENMEMLALDFNENKINSIYQTIRLCNIKLISN